MDTGSLIIEDREETCLDEVAFLGGHMLAGVEVGLEAGSLGRFHAAEDCAVPEPTVVRDLAVGISPLLQIELRDVVVIHARSLASACFRRRGRLMTPADLGIALVLGDSEFNTRRVVAIWTLLAYKRNRHSLPSRARIVGR